MLKEPYELLLAIRLDLEYRVEQAIELPRAVLEDHYPRETRASWSNRLEQDARTRRITAEELVLKLDR